MGPLTLSTTTEVFWNGKGHRLTEIANVTKRNGSYKTKEILKRRIVNLSDIRFTQSETDLLQKGLNFCPTPPPPPTIDNINKDIDAFARRLSLREYHTPENIDEITDNPSYQPTILEKLNHREQKTHCRPSREPYLNTYIEKLRQEITDRTIHNRRFQRNNLSKRERLALDRLSNNRDIIIKPADKGGATVIREFKIRRLRITTTDKHATAHDQNHVTVHFSPVVLRLR